jgi:hypothetical protein
MSVRNIILTDGIDTVTLLSDLVFDVAAEEISKIATMASGRLVKDIVGYKDVLQIPVGYLSLSDMSKLRDMIKRNKGLLEISYPTPTGDMVNQFLVEQPTYTTFAYDDNGVSVWKGVTIVATSVEVVE